MVAWAESAPGVAAGFAAAPHTGGSFSAMTLSNTLLAASTVLYLANLVFRSRGVGRLATLLAAAGAFGIGGALVMRGVELSAVGAMPLPRRSYLYEATALFSAVSVFIYLAMESVFRSRSVGAFVMPVIMAAVACELWLVWAGPLAAEAGPNGAALYWRQSWAVASVISELALCAAAIAGVLHLLRVTLESGRANCMQMTRVLPSAWRAFDLIVTGVAVGFPLYLLAAIIGVATSWTQMRGVSAGSALAAAGVVAIYGWFFHMVYRGRGSGTRIALCAIAGCGASFAAVAGAGPFAVLAAAIAGAAA